MTNSFIGARIIALLIGYLFGLIETGYFYGKKKDFDLRKHGSGNMGATNTVRTMGWKAGVVVLVGDAVKAFVAVIVVRLIYRGIAPDYTVLLGFYAGAGAIIGHDYPIYLHFKGGKGMSSTVGMLVATAPIMIPFEVIIFIIPVLISKYVSLGSILAYLFMPLTAYVCMKLGLMNIPEGNQTEVVIIFCVLMVLCIIRHWGNVKRLIKGEENPFIPPKKKKEEN